jgi:ABC-type sugar transport system ATPase subunit
VRVVKTSAQGRFALGCLWSEAKTGISEKQLLCMARAILKRSRVLVMDEATARYADNVVALRFAHIGEALTT